MVSPQPNRHAGCGPDPIPHSVGLRTSIVYAAAPTDASLPLPPDVAAKPHFAIALGGANATVGWATGRPHTVAELAAAISAARTAELTRYTQFGALAETNKVVQAAVMWTSIYNPLESGPFANVIRGNPFFLDNNAMNKDWAYVIFDVRCPPPNNVFFIPTHLYA